MHPCRSRSPPIGLRTCASAGAFKKAKLASRNVPSIIIRRGLVIDNLSLKSTMVAFALFEDANPNQPSACIIENRSRKAMTEAGFSVLIRSSAADIAVAAVDPAVRAGTPVNGGRKEKMKLLTTALLFALLGASPAFAQQTCIITKEKAAQLRPGATLEGIQRSLGWRCKLMQQSSTGFGDTLQELYAVQDDGSNRLFVLLGKSGRLLRVNYIARQLNPPDPLSPPPAPQKQRRR
jgi:hypothetical protein